MKAASWILVVVSCASVSAWGQATRTSVPLEGSPAESRDAGWVSRRVEAWRPTREERAFHEIGWARDLREARRLGGEHNRPVFLFTYDGESLSGYRC